MIFAEPVAAAPDGQDAGGWPDSRLSPGAQPFPRGHTSSQDQGQTLQGDMKLRNYLPYFLLLFCSPFVPHSALSVSYLTLPSIPIPNILNLISVHLHQAGQQSGRQGSVVEAEADWRICAWGGPGHPGARLQAVRVENLQRVSGLICVVA